MTCALVVAAPASATTNLVPNPGFEDVCGPATKACDWHELSSIPRSIPSKPFRVGIAFSCQPNPCPGAQLNFDDLRIGPPLTSVSLSLIRVERTRSGVRLRWRTSSEVETLGFDVYRQRHGKLVKLNRALIPSVFGGTPSGHAYSWLDRTAPKSAAKYRLQAVSMSGTRSWAGATSVGR